MNRYLLNTTILCTVAILVFPACKKERAQWKQVEKIESYTNNRLNGVYFIDNNTGFVVGGSRFMEANLLITHDGGKNWSLNSFPEAGKGLYGIASAPSGRIMTIGFDGKIMYSEDTGSNWQFVQLNPWYTYKDIVFKTDNSGIAIGGHSFNSGMIVMISKDGQNIFQDSLAIELNKIQMADDMTGYISGYGVVMKTTDGGYNWTFLDIKNDNFTGIHMLNKNEVWVCGYRGSIFHTKDGGANWDKLRNGNNLTQKQYSLLGIYFKDADNGWACGEKGLLIKTTDGGKNWSEYENFTDNALRDIALAPDGNLIVAGDNGSLYKLYIN